jgi:DNA invertase Pin-like site-specific DNA recombinase
MTTEARVFCYGRASTAKQVDSPETQKDIHKRYAEFNQLGEITATFIDPATSGKVDLEKRAAGKELLKAIRPGDHVIISKLDRMFRRAKDCLVILDEFQAKGINLHVCDLMGGAINLSSPMGRFLIQILAAVAELERNYISQRTKDGLAAKKRAGKKSTRFPGYGRKWVKDKGPDGKLCKMSVRDDDERDVMKSIVMWRMQANPFTWEEIEAHLRKLEIINKEGRHWSQSRIRRACQAEFKLQYQENKARGATPTSHWRSRST